MFVYYISTIIIVQQDEALHFDSDRTFCGITVLLVDLVYILSHRNNTVNGESLEQHI